MNLSDVVLDLLRKVQAHLAVLVQLSLPLLLVRGDPWVLQKFICRGTFARVVLHAFDQKVAQVFLEDTTVLGTVDDTVWVKG